MEKLSNKRNKQYPLKLNPKKIRRPNAISKWSKKIVISKSIKYKLICTYVLFAAIPLLIVNMISSIRFGKALSNTSMQLTSEMTKQARSNINYFTNDIEKNISKFILSNLNTTTDSLINNYSSAKDVNRQQAALNDIRRQLTTISVVEKSIAGVMLVTKDGAPIGDIGSLTEEQMKSFSKVELNNSSKWYRSAEIPNKLFYIQPIKNSITGQDFGCLVADINLTLLSDDITEIELFKGANVYILDENNEFLCGARTEEVNKEIIQRLTEGKEENSESIRGTLYAFAEADCGWKMIVEIPESTLNASIRENNRLVWALVIIISLLAAGVGIWVSKGFTGPIIGLMRKMKAAEQGDLTVQSEASGKDEMHMLCESFNNMISNIRETIIETRNAVNTTIQNGEVLAANTGQSMENFSKLAASIEDIAQGSSRQAGDTVDSSAVMEELSDSIQKVRKNTQNVFEDTKGARDMIEDATLSIDLLNQTMVSSVKMLGQIQDSIIELSKLTKSIEQIMSFVDSISEQTNLLALNASIEAARAGEVGKGFAVVAQEVRNLSEQSKKSTSSVRTALNTIEKQTKETVDLVTQSNEILKEQEQAVQKADNSVNQIITVLKNIDDELSLVNNQTMEMQCLKDDMNGKIERIMTVTQENASATQEVNALSEDQKEVMEKLLNLAEELNQTMDFLDKSVKKFTI